MARTLTLAVVLSLPLLAEAEPSPTVLAQHCLVEAVAKGKGARVCFTEAGWEKYGAGFIEQQRRKKWTVQPGADGPCCNEKVLWAEVVLRKGEKVVDRVFLLLEKAGSLSGDKEGLRIAELTEADPRGGSRR